MRYTTPTDDEIYARLSPELRRQFDRERKARRQENDRSLQQVFDQRNLDRPAWRTDVPQETRDATGGAQLLPLTLDADVPDGKKAVRR